MNKKIIAMIRPFDAQQILMVYEDGNKIDMIQSDIEHLYTNLFALADKHETYQLDLVGPKKYVKGLKNQIDKEGVLKYNENKLIINII
jgi:hypothetical protein